MRLAILYHRFSNSLGLQFNRTDDSGGEQGMSIGLQVKCRAYHVLGSEQNFYRPRINHCNSIPKFAEMSIEHIVEPSIVVQNIQDRVLSCRVLQQFAGLVIGPTPKDIQTAKALGNLTPINLLWQVEKRQVTSPSLESG